MDLRVVSMPYILLKTTIGNFPFLIDTGANINIISPKLAYSFKHSKYILHKFHNFFEGIIGTNILNTLGAIIDLRSKILTLKLCEQTLTIPLQSYIPQQKTSNSLTVTTPNTSTNDIVESVFTDDSNGMQSKNDLDPTSFRTSHLSAEQNKNLLDVLQGNHSAFYKPDTKLTCSTVVECSINTTDDIPVHQKVYPYPAAYVDEVNKQINKLLSDGIIRPSRSAWTSPVWIVLKKIDASGEKKFRMVLDYRKLNEKTISDR